jgi:hypothetical protein
MEKLVDDIVSGVYFISIVSQFFTVNIKMKRILETFKKTSSSWVKLGDKAQDLPDVLIPKTAHQTAKVLHLPARAETVLGYAGAVVFCTAALIAGSAGAVAAPIAAVAVGIFGSPVIAVTIAAVIPVGIVAGYMGMAMSESRALSDGYAGYADMKEKMFPSVAAPSEQPRKDWAQKIRGVFGRVATKALPADQSPQSLPQAAHPAPLRP